MRRACFCGNRLRGVGGLELVEFLRGRGLGGVVVRANGAARKQRRCDGCRERGGKKRCLTHGQKPLRYAPVRLSSAPGAAARKIPASAAGRTPSRRSFP